MGAPAEHRTHPPHRADAGAFLLAETFGTKTLTLVKDVDGVHEADPKKDPSAKLIPEISAQALDEKKLETLPFDRVLLELMRLSKLVESFQVVNGTKPELIARALEGEHVGTIVHRG